MKPPTSLAAMARHAAGLIEAGQHKAAERILKDILRSDPGQPDALVFLGILSGMRGRLNDAVKYLSAGARRQPDNDAAHYNLGQALIRLGRFDEAARALSQAAARADRPEIHEKLGDCLIRLKRLDEAVASFTRAVSFAAGELPASHEAMALSSLVETKRRIGDWQDLAEFEDRLSRRIRTGFPAEPLLTLYIDDDPALHHLNATAYARDFLRPIIAASQPPKPYRHPVRNRERIRLGYLSTDFRAHATSRLIAGMIEAHDRARFEVVGLSFGRDDQSPMRQRMKTAFDRFVDLAGLTSKEIARRIHAQEIDILIDLNGYIADSQPDILGHRPAPVQCHYLAFPGTLGGDAIDYMLVDPIIVPSGEQAHFTEALVRLPECYQANDAKREVAPATPLRADCGLPEHGFVFCAFNNAIKISPAVFEVWMRILTAVPASVLWLHQDDKALAGNLRREAEARAVDPDRLVFADFAEPPEHLARMKCADLFIDTFPYTGHTTASDALWVGLPVLTSPGRTFASRVGASLLTAAGLPELIMPSLEAFELEAIALARDPARLATLQQRLASQRDSCALFDTARFTHHLEAAYIEMWARWQRGDAPAGFDVAPLP